MSNLIMEQYLKLDSLNGYQFEELVAKIMKKKGYINIKVTTKSHDKGKDVIMEDALGNIILVECKHQQFVGRPIIQKLQGAISHEQAQYRAKKVKGMIVTTGSFSHEAITYNKEISEEIELIDGRKLNQLCKESSIFILNGKIQIITNESIENTSTKACEENILSQYKKIYGSDLNNISTKLDCKYMPVCHIEFSVNFEIKTTVGTLDYYSDSGDIAINGTDGKFIDKNVKEFYFSNHFNRYDIPISEEHKKIPFEFTESDIEEYAIGLIIKAHTHNISYKGRNNVRYTKSCIPNHRDIDINKFLALYLPYWTCTIKIMDMKYTQEFYAYGESKCYLKNELKECKICSSFNSTYEDMSVCPECGRIVCKRHRRIDYLDKVTPICSIHAKGYKLYLQTKYFAKDENLVQYRKWFLGQNFFKKLYEDKIAFALIIILLFLFVVFLVWIL